MTTGTVQIVCGKAPRHVVWVPAVRMFAYGGVKWALGAPEEWWECSYCGARVKVVA